MLPAGRKLIATTLTHRRFRAHVVVVLLCLVGILLLLILLPQGKAKTAVTKPKPAPAVRWTVTQAKPADAFVDSIGVNTHLSYTDTPYNDYAQVQAALSELGVRHIRDFLYAGNQRELAFLKQLNHQDGVTMSVINDGRYNAVGLQGIDTLRDTIVRDGLLAAVSNVEGPNELDDIDPTQIGPYQQMLYLAWRDDKATAGIPVAGPSFAKETDTAVFQGVGSLAQYLDYGNLHDYPGQGQELTGPIIAAIEHNNSLVSGNKPFIATETGYSTGLQATDAPPGNPPISAAAAGIMLPQLYLQSFLSGVVRTYSYELLDEFDNSSFYSNFGLMTAGFVPKPAYTALQNLISLFSDPGPTFTPGSLAYNLQGADADTKTLLLQKRNGTFYLAVWEQEPVWNVAAQALVPQASRTLQLTLRDQASVSTVTSAKTVASDGPSTRTYRFAASADPIYLQLTDGASTAP